MADYMIHGKTLESIADAIRGKTGGTSPVPVSAMAEQITGITTGGGSSEDVRYVTFMTHDGSAELGKKPVAVGDNCADPIARGLFPTPIRESTVQYDYSFVGWANTENGAWDKSALNAITEDKTVYASYASVVRYYTVTYYDSDGSTVLKTESLAYGAMPNYIPAKAGSTFDGWTPALAAVTGDASYTASWIAKPDFNALTWAQIAQYSKSGEAATMFDLGATKTFTVRQPFNGVSQDITVTAQIVGFNHDDLADGSGKAGITLRLIDLPVGLDAWAGSGASAANYNKMWDDCSVRTAFRDMTIYDTFTFPADFLAVLKPVTKIFYDAADKAYNTCEDTFFLPSVSELGWARNAEGECYALFSDGKNNTTEYAELVVNSPAQGKAVEYWTRTKYATGVESTFYVTAKGKFISGNQGASKGRYAFVCI